MPPSRLGLFARGAFDRTRNLWRHIGSMASDAANRVSRAAEKHRAAIDAGLAYGAWFLYAAAVACILVSGTRWLAWSVPLLLVGFVISAIRKRRFSEIEVAVLTVVLAHVAAARWSMELDHQADLRASDAELRQVHRADSIATANRTMDAARADFEAHARDSAVVDVAIRGLEETQSAVRENRAILLDELEKLKGSVARLDPLIPLDTNWWPLFSQHVPIAIARRPTMLDSLRLAARVANYVDLEQATRQDFSIIQEGHMLQVQGQENPYNRRMILYDTAILKRASRLDSLAGSVVRDLGALH